MVRLNAIKGLVFGGASLLTHRLFIQDRPLSAKEVSVFMGVYMLAITPFSVGIKHLNDWVFDKVVFAEFRQLYKDNNFVLRNYFFNKRFMAMDFVINHFFAQMVSFMMLEKAYEKLLVPSPQSKQVIYNKYEKAFYALLSLIPFSVVNHIGFGFYYTQKKVAPKAFQIFNLVIRVGFMVKCLNIITGKNNDSR